jgi:ABC-type glycerol-3-phosphate transport system substrate-binding protein
VPKKAVVTFLVLALIGAAAFVYFTFPRTRDEIPTSNNQRPFPSSPGPNGVPVPETVPHPTPPAKPGGPTLQVRAWATPEEGQILEAEASAFQAKTGEGVALTLSSDMASYRRDLRAALASDAPPDVCLIEARDFSGLEPEQDLARVAVPAGVSPRSVSAFMVGGNLRAAPDEFSVEMLFYNPHFFDEAGIAYPGRHWTWDIVEGITRAMASLKLKNEAGEPVYPLELPADFDFWNILCSQDGHPALDRGTWHLADEDGKDCQMRGLDLIHEFFHELAVTAPAPKQGEAAGRFFAQQRAALLIAPSERAASLPNFPYEMTVLPEDLTRASLARVNGWAVTARSTQLDSARALAQFLARQPVHAGWSSVRTPADEESREGLCYEALEQSVIPRLEPKSARLAELLDEQINGFARSDEATSSGDLYGRIQAEYLAGYATAAERSAAPKPMEVAPRRDVQLRGL